MTVCTSLSLSHYLHVGLSLSLSHYKLSTPLPVLHDDNCFAHTFARFTSITSMRLEMLSTLLFLLIRINKTFCWRRKRLNQSLEQVKEMKMVLEADQSIIMGVTSLDHQHQRVQIHRLYPSQSIDLLHETGITKL